MTGQHIFDNYKELMLEREVLEIQIKNFLGVSDAEIIASMAFSHPGDDDVRVQTSGTSDKTSSIALSYSDKAKRENEEWYSWLLQQYLELDAELCFFDECIDKLDGKRATVIRALLNGDTWDSICYNNYIARSTLSKYRKEAIKMIQERMDYREQKRLHYLLYA